MRKRKLRSRTFSLLGLLGLLGAGALAACGGGDDRARSPSAAAAPSRGPAAIQVFDAREQPGTASPTFESRAPEGSQAEAPSYQWSNVDPTYQSAVSSFRGEIHRVVESGQELERMRQALYLLASALEKVPGAASNEVQATASLIRDDASKLSHPVPESTSTQGQKRRTVKDALTAASERLEALATGPYKSDPRVLQAARDLEEQVAEISESDIIWTNNSTVYRSLLDAEGVLRAMGLAIAEGKVRIGETAPRRD